MSIDIPQMVSTNEDWIGRREERDVFIMTIYLVEAQLIGGGLLLGFIGLKEEEPDRERDSCAS